MPEIQFADLKRAHQKKEMKGAFSSFLLKQVEETLKANKQVIYFRIEEDTPKAAVYNVWLYPCARSVMYP